LIISTYVRIDLPGVRGEGPRARGVAPVWGASAMGRLRQRGEERERRNMTAQEGVLKAAGGERKWR